MDVRTVWLARVPHRVRRTLVGHRLCAVQIEAGVLSVKGSIDPVEIPVADCEMTLLRHKDPRQGVLGTVVRLERDGVKLNIAGGAQVADELLAGETAEAGVLMGSSDFMAFLDEVSKMHPSRVSYRKPIVRPERLRTLELFVEPEVVPGLPTVMLVSSVAWLLIGAVIAIERRSTDAVVAGAVAAIFFVGLSNYQARARNGVSGYRLQLSGDHVRLIKDHDGEIASLSRAELADVLPEKPRINQVLTLPFKELPMRIRQRSIGPDSGSGPRLYGLRRRDIAALLRFADPEFMA